MKSNIEFYVSNEEIIKCLTDYLSQFDFDFKELNLSDPFIFRVFQDYENKQTYIYIGKKENIMYFIAVYLQENLDNWDYIFYNDEGVYFIKDYIVENFLPEENYYKIYKKDKVVTADEISHTLRSSNRSLLDAVKIESYKFRFKYE